MKPRIGDGTFYKSRLQLDLPAMVLGYPKISSNVH